MEAPESAKTITVYVNGDQNFGGKKFIVNRRRTPTFDTLLGDVSTPSVFLLLVSAFIVPWECRDAYLWGGVFDSSSCKIDEPRLRFNGFYSPLQGIRISPLLLPWSSFTQGRNQINLCNHLRWPVASMPHLAPFAISTLPSAARASSTWPSCSLARRTSPLVVQGPSSRRSNMVPSQGHVEHGAR